MSAGRHQSAADALQALLQAVRAAGPGGLSLAVYARRHGLSLWTTKKRIQALASAGDVECLRRGTCCVWIAVQAEPTPARSRRNATPWAWDAAAHQERLQQGRADPERVRIEAHRASMLFGQVMQRPAPR